jgi:hypothetical protein
MSTIWKLLVVALLVALGVNSYFLYETHSTASNITTYLGSNNGARSTWTGFVGRLTENTEDERSALRDLDCRIIELKNKVENRNDQCGPPGTVPKDPPTYP